MFEAFFPEPQPLTRQEMQQMLSDPTFSHEWDEWSESCGFDEPLTPEEEAAMLEELARENAMAEAFADDVARLNEEIPF